jgi:hypothetical protein
MNTLIYFDDGGPKAVSNSNPLPVIFAGYSSDSFNTSVTYDNASTLSVLKAATASKSIYITDLIVSASAAMSFVLKDSAGTIVMDRTYVAANSVSSIPLSTPLKVTSGKDLMVITSAAAPVTFTVSGKVY